MTDLKQQHGKVFFIGAGPGAPDLVTVRGNRIIQEADCIIYAGSLVNPALFDGLETPLYDSSGLHLDVIISIMAEHTDQGHVVARVHTGDPCLYGAIGEQIERLDSLSIDYEIIPGVSSAFGAAAALQVELTLPELTQTVILTRREGRTPVPDKEHLSLLAQHCSTMIIFLSVGMIDAVVEDLKKGGLPEDTPVAVVMRATWHDEKQIRGTLLDIGGKVSAEGIKKTALICVGAVFGDIPQAALSKLYDKKFSHEYRTALPKS
jgi:precorrin-4/cobalt-precorrin-4 C11-methyltransferase